MHLLIYAISKSVCQVIYMYKNVCGDVRVENKRLFHWDNKQTNANGLVGDVDV